MAVIQCPAATGYYLAQCCALAVGWTPGPAWTVNQGKDQRAPAEPPVRLNACSPVRKTAVPRS